MGPESSPWFSGDQVGGTQTETNTDIGDEFDIGELELPQTIPSTEPSRGYRMGEIELLDRNPYIRRVRVKTAIKLVDDTPVFMQPDELETAVPAYEHFKHQPAIPFGDDWDEDDDRHHDILTSRSPRTPWVAPHEMLNLDSEKPRVEWGSDASSKLSFVLRHLPPADRQAFESALDNGETVETSLIFGPKWHITHFGMNGHVEQFNYPGPQPDNISTQHYTRATDRQFRGSNTVVFTTIETEHDTAGRLRIVERLVAEANIGTKSAQTVNVADPTSYHPGERVRVKRDLDSLHERYLSDDPTLQTPEYPYNQFRSLADSTDRSERRWVGPAFSRFLQTQLNTESYARQVVDRKWHIDKYGNAVFSPNNGQTRTEVRYKKAFRVNVARDGYLHRRLAYLTEESHKERRIHKLESVREKMYDAALKVVVQERGVAGLVQEVWRSEANRRYFLKRSRDGDMRELSYLLYLATEDVGQNGDGETRLATALSMVEELVAHGTALSQDAETKNRDAAARTIRRNLTELERTRGKRGQALKDEVAEYLHSRPGQAEIARLARKSRRSNPLGDDFAWPKDKHWDGLRTRLRYMFRTNYFQPPSVSWHTELSIHGPKQGLHHATRRLPFGHEPSRTTQGRIVEVADGALEPSLPTAPNSDTPETTRKRDHLIAAFDIYPPETTIEAEQEKLARELIDYVRWWIVPAQMRPNTYALHRDRERRKIKLADGQTIKLRSGNDLYNRGRVLFRNANHANGPRSSQVEIRALFERARGLASEAFRDDPELGESVMPLLDYQDVAETAGDARHDSANMGETFVGMALEANPNQLLGLGDHLEHMHHEIVFLQTTQHTGDNLIIDQFNEMAQGPKPIGGWGNWRLELERLGHHLDPDVLEAVHYDRTERRGNSEPNSLFGDIPAGLAVVEQLKTLFNDAKRVGEDRCRHNAPMILEILTNLGLSEEQATHVLVKGLEIRRTPDVLVRTYDGATGEVMISVIDAKTYLKPITGDTARNIVYDYQPFLDVGMRLVIPTNCVDSHVNDDARAVFARNGVHLISGTTVAQILESDLPDDYPVPMTIQPPIKHVANATYAYRPDNQTESIAELYRRFCAHPGATASEAKAVAILRRYAEILDQHRLHQTALAAAKQELQTIYSA